MHCYTTCTNAISPITHNGIYNIDSDRNTSTLTISIIRDNRKEKTRGRIAANLTIHDIKMGCTCCKISTGRDQLRHYKEFMDQWGRKDERYHQVTKMLSLLPVKQRKTEAATNREKENDRVYTRENETMMTMNSDTNMNGNASGGGDFSGESICKQPVKKGLDAQVAMFCTEERNKDSAGSDSTQQRNINAPNAARKTNRWAWPRERGTDPQKYSLSTDDELTGEGTMRRNPSQETLERKRRPTNCRVRWAWLDRRSTTPEADDYAVVEDFTPLETITSHENSACAIVHT